MGGGTPLPGKLIEVDSKRKDMKEIRSKLLLENFVEDYISSGELRDDFLALSPWQRIQIFQRLSGFVLPKIKSVEIDMHSGSESPEKQRLFLGLMARPIHDTPQNIVTNNVSGIVSGTARDQK